MPRWEHGSLERLQRAAFELFEEQGFPATSAVQIAERAGVTTRTFFRYFGDKEEVPFADAGRLRAALVEAVRHAGDIAEPLHVVTLALAGFDWGSLGSRESQRRRDLMIAANPELLERDLIKQQQLGDGFGDALRRRGVDPDVAELAARVGIQVFRIAYQRWVHAERDLDLRALTAAELSRLARIVPVGT
ncbi:TetR family transcriptional regulator [Dactylosporangium sp. NPDC051541]|uniref:TetR family transcriptional regulator n=1 Tax=Dactylosporangium sp. NPDC051541 TaxID=3363977 RepID=UPI00378C397C